jgi:ferredoxin
MARPMWMIKLLMKTFPKRGGLAKMTRYPLVGRLVDSMLFDGDEIIYLARDEVIEIEVGKSFGDLEHTVLPSQVVEHFIDASSHRWIMNWCICRKSSKCKDYPVDLGCLFLGEASRDIDPRLGRTATKEEAKEHIRRCREAGLVQMVGRNKLDAAWLDVSPGERLLSICNCCPCCCLWKMLPKLSHKISSKVTKMPGIQVSVTEKCNGCGTCSKGVCFVDAIRMEGKRAMISGECRGCGRCVVACPSGAIDLRVGDMDFITKSIARISSSVDVA